MPIVIELFKKVAACRKHEYGQFLKIIGIVLIIYIFKGFRTTVLILLELR